MPVSDPLTHEQFHEFVRSHSMAVIHFHASWNVHDQTMKAQLESQITKELRDNVAFAQIDASIPENYALCRQHGVLNLPFLALYRNGVFVTSITGLRKAAELSAFLHKRLLT